MQHLYVLCIHIVGVTSRSISRRNAVAWWRCTCSCVRAWVLLLFERVCVKEQCGNLQVFERVGVRQHGNSVMVLQVFERVGVRQHGNSVIVLQVFERVGVRQHGNSVPIISETRTTPATPLSPA